MKICILINSQMFKPPLRQPFDLYTPVNIYMQRREGYLSSRN